MRQSLTKLLEKIGGEIHDRGYVNAKGVVQPITKDEQLAREIWRRALGYEKETFNDDGTMQHRVFDPDPRMQQFLIERREGKVVTPIDDGGMSLLEKISELARNQVNNISEQVVNDSDDS